MMILCAIASAFAVDLAAFAGDWGVDPAKSDDAAAAVMGAPPGAGLGQGAAEGLSPDQQGEDPEELDAARQRMLSDILLMLSGSGQMMLRPSGESLEITLAGEAPVRLEVDGPWGRMDCGDARCRLRLRDEGDRLLLERRMKATKIEETLLPPAPDGTMVAVVHVVTSSAARPIELRRVYRRLGS
jgi:hypothetical protein